MYIPSNIWKQRVKLANALKDPVFKTALVQVFSLASFSLVMSFNLKKY